MISWHNLEIINSITGQLLENTKPSVNKHNKNKDSELVFNGLSKIIGVLQFQPAARKSI